MMKSKDEVDGQMKALSNFIDEIVERLKKAEVEKEYNRLDVLWKLHQAACGLIRGLQWVYGVEEADDPMTQIMELGIMLKTKNASQNALKGMGFDSDYDRKWKDLPDFKKAFGSGRNTMWADRGGID